jgi:CTP synthase
MVELEDHPWFVGCQFHPELKSRPNRPHPLFAGFVGAAAAHGAARAGADSATSNTSGGAPADGAEAPASAYVPVDGAAAGRAAFAEAR